jgi:hypothetical protein
MINAREAIGIACQLAFEYGEPTWELIDDMLMTYTDAGDSVPCSGDELFILTMHAKEKKEAGLSYSAVERKLLSLYE